jgi:PBP1b-binding outer membrane lipoprotein LpoB
MLRKSFLIMVLLLLALFLVACGTPGSVTVEETPPAVEEETAPEVVEEEPAETAVAEEEPARKRRPRAHRGN